MAGYSAGSDATKWITGRNDWQAATPQIANTGWGGGTPGEYTEGGYQNAKRIYEYYANHPNELAALPPATQQIVMRPPPPPEANPYQGQLNLTRQYTNPLLGQLSDAAAGRGPSQAQDMLREGTNTAVSTAYGGALTPSVGGAAQAALVAEAGRTAAGTMQQGARQAAQLRAQEMSDARQQLSNTIGSTSGQYMTQAQIDADRQKANLQSTMGMNTLNQKTGSENKGGVGGFIGGILGSLSDIKAKEDVQPLAEPAQFKRTVPSAAYFGNPAMAGRPIPMDDPMDASSAYDAMDGNRYGSAPEEKKGDWLSALGAGFSAMSDARSKEKIRQLEGALDESRRTADTIRGTSVGYPSIPNLGGDGKPADDDMRTVQGPLAPWNSRSGRPLAANFARFGTPDGYAELATPGGSRLALAPVGAYEYRYKPQYAAAMGTDTAPRAGVMAQQLERSPNPALRSAVIDTPMGKAIDGRRAVSANLALSAGLDKRVRNIEEGLNLPVSYPNLRR